MRMDTSDPIDNEVIVSTHAPDLYRYDATPQRIACLADIGPEEVAFFHVEPPKLRTSSIKLSK